jgi:hypothetical protein
MQVQFIWRLHLLGELQLSAVMQHAISSMSADFRL